MPSSRSSDWRASIVAASAKPFSVTLQPYAASAFTVAKPVPPSEPVINADLPASM